MIDSAGRCTICQQVVGPNMIHSCAGSPWPMSTTWPPSGSTLPDLQRQIESLERRVRELERAARGDPRDE